MHVTYTQRRSAQFRGPSSSDDYNARIEEYYKDLVVLINRVRLLEVEDQELFRRLAKEFLAIVRKLEDLEARVLELESGDGLISFFNEDQIDNDRFNDQPSYNIEEVDRLSHDTQHGIVILPKVDSSSLSKLFFTNTDGDEVVPPTLETRVVPDPASADNTNALIDTSQPELALYRRPGLIWERTVVADTADAQGAALTLYVKVPTELFTTDKSNAVMIHPYPAFGCDIEEIAYTVNASPALDDGDGYAALNATAEWEGEEDAVGWVAPGGWGGASTGEDFARDAGNRIYYFSPLTVTGLRIKLRQNEYYKENGKYLYTYGLSQLDLRYDKFLTTGKTMIKLDAADGTTISEITDVQPQIWNVSLASLDDVFDYRVIWETAFNTGVYTTTPVASSQRVWLEVTLQGTDGWTPALSGLIVSYT